MAALTTAALIGIPLAMQAADLLSAYWGRGTQREQLAGEKKSAEAQAEVASRLLKEARTSKRRDIERLLQERKTARESEREAEMMRLFSESQNQKIAMILSAMQGMNQPPVRPSGGGMLNILRSNY